MNLTKLNNFMEFKVNEFLQGLTLELCSIKFDKDNNLIKANLVIIDDKRNDNKYGKVSVKFPANSNTQLNSYNVGNQYEVVNPIKTSLWGSNNIKDNITITCEGLAEVIEVKE